MRELHFDVAGQLLRRNKQCDFENIVRGSDNYLCLVFHFDNDWKETKRVISFYDVDGEVHKNIGDATRGQIRKLRENLVVRQKEQPTDPNNNVWISDEDDEVEVPDMGEFNSLKEDIEYYKDDNGDGNYSEGVHPNSFGHEKFIAPKIKLFLEFLIN